MINIYPNPATSLVHISDHGNLLNKATINIINLQGRQIKKIYFESTEPQKTIDISTLEIGIYFINISVADSQILKTTRLVKTD